MYCTVSSRIASFAYQKWHTSNLVFCVQLQIEQIELLTYLRLENRSRQFLFQYVSSFTLPDKTALELQREPVT